MASKEHLKPDFLTALENSLNITRAAKSVGVCKQTVYNWRDDDPEFAAALAEAKEVALDTLEDCLFKQAQDGNVVAAIFLLKGHRKHYCDRLQLEHSQGPTQHDDMSEVFSVIDSMADRKLSNGTAQIEAPKE